MDASEDRPLYRAMLELAGASAPELMKTLVYQDPRIGRVFPLLMVFCAEVVAREGKESARVVFENGRGFEADDECMCRLSGKAAVYFLDGYAQRFRPKALPKGLDRYAEKTAARLMEAARNRLVWGELTGRETALLEPAGVAMIRNGLCRDAADPRLALPGNLLQPTLNFIVRWGRAKGLMPAWYRGPS